MAIKNAYGPNAIATAFQIAEELHGQAWLKKKIPARRHASPSATSPYATQSDIQGYMKLRGKLSFADLQGIRAAVKNSTGPSQLEKAITDQYGPDALPIARTIAAGKKVFEWNRQAKKSDFAPSHHPVTSQDRALHTYGGLHLSVESMARIRAIAKEAKSLNEMNEAIVSEFGAQVIPVAREIAAELKGLNFLRGGIESTNSDVNGDPDSVSTIPIKRGVPQGQYAPIPPASSLSFSWRFGHFVAYLWQYAFVKFVFWGSVLCALGLAADKYDNYREAENFKAERASVGSLATVAGAMWASAVRSCNTIGLPEVQECANNTGLLVQDTTAKVMAEIALKQAEKYLSTCGRHYSHQYCLDLVNRAYRISLRTN
jgi:hypothetical protein